jgi:hypothetical protein
VGAVAGVIAIGGKSSDCTGATCKAGTLDGIKSTAVVSDIGLIAGGVLFATGAVLVLFAPAGRRNQTTGVRVAPTFTAGGGGVALRGTW